MECNNAIERGLEKALGPPEGMTREDFLDSWLRLLQLAEVNACSAKPSEYARWIRGMMSRITLRVGAQSCERVHWRGCKAIATEQVLVGRLRRRSLAGQSKQRQPKMAWHIEAWIAAYQGEEDSEIARGIVAPQATVQFSKQLPSTIDASQAQPAKPVTEPTAKQNAKSPQRLSLSPSPRRSTSEGGHETEAQSHMSEGGRPKTAPAALRPRPSHAGISLPACALDRVTLSSGMPALLDPMPAIWPSAMPPSAMLPSACLISKRQHRGSMRKVVAIRPLRPRALTAPGKIPPSQAPSPRASAWAKGRTAKSHKRGIVSLPAKAVTAAAVEMAARKEAAARVAKAKAVAARVDQEAVVVARAVEVKKTAVRAAWRAVAAKVVAETTEAWEIREQVREVGVMTAARQLTASVEETLAEARRLTALS